METSRESTPVAYSLVDNDTDSSRCNIVDDACPPMVVLVWHALLLRSVGLDVHNVTNLVDSHILRELDTAMVLETNLEHVARARSVTIAVRPRNRAMRTTFTDSRQERAHMLGRQSLRTPIEPLQTNCYLVGSYLQLFCSSRELCFFSSKARLCAQ